MIIEFKGSNKVIPQDVKKTQHVVNFFLSDFSLKDVYNGTLLSSDIFVMKFVPNKTLVFSTFVSGRHFEDIGSIVVDGNCNGNPIVNYGSCGSNYCDSSIKTI